MRELLGERDAAAARAEIAREAALLAAKADVTEECVRLRTHIEDLERALREDGAVGRRMDFLAQEIHREVNTIGSKSSDPEIARAVVAAKAEVDRVKEQAANLE
ncbi:MAG: DUF1732 domain-containing protein [Planctomycetales bacterium]|nr:DUF1732 domain-containing protein [Planctomycetales bacterium]